MMPPAYFERVRENASRRWVQLESDADLAGPWHQLFKQVQSPRHVLSELLQNADDAEATEATVHVEDRCFVFSHNGRDFDEEQFTSLCRFGYSNKRALHTIGFRGIGFKSTFSLGNVVQLQTPTLSIAFDRKRFTEPKWISVKALSGGRTEVRVAISDQHRQREVEKNLEEWLTTPVSLLFFKRIRRLRIGKQELQWKTLGVGPVPDSEWMSLQGSSEDVVLLVRSESAAFPSDSLAEIREERLSSVDQETEFPPCRVEIVLGGRGRLYVVLPTGVETKLPFACNAPFIQDPARLKIKDAGVSPTNRWLLGRVGALASSTMLRWLRDSAASPEERSRAYGFLPDIQREDSSLEGTCATTVESAFKETLGEQPFVLTEAGELKPRNQVIGIPKGLLGVWPTNQTASMLDSSNRAPLSPCVASRDREKLIQWKAVEEIDNDQVMTVLQEKHLPKPETWQCLMKLWAFVAPKIAWMGMIATRSKLRIIPVQGKNVLYSAGEVDRLGEKRLLASDADWDFLSAHLLVMNQNWPRFLAEKRRLSDREGDEGASQQIAAVSDVLRVLDLEGSSDVSSVVEHVAAAFFKQESNSLDQCVHLAQIAAKLEAQVGDSMRFATRDGFLKAPDHHILFDRDGGLEDLVPVGWQHEHVLHERYTKSFVSCTVQEWRDWTTSGRSRLLEFVPLSKSERRLLRRERIESEIRDRGGLPKLDFPFRTSEFLLEDWDFDKSFWRHWYDLAARDSTVWGRIVERILGQPEVFSITSKCARALQIATTGNTRPITSDSLLPTWVFKLREVPCLPDTRGFYRKPGELLRRTQETEALMDLEPFVHSRFDTEGNRQFLTILGVRDKPTGPDRLLECLRALAKAQSPPIAEIEKWYRRLDQLIESCSTSDSEKIRRAFREERLILTEQGDWATVSGVYLQAEEADVPGAALVRSGVRDLTLWQKLGVAQRPTADLAIAWLKERLSGKPLTPDEFRRVRALLARHPVRIWMECGHWLNLAREWAPVNTLKYSLSMHSLVEWGHLHPSVKQETADLQGLPEEMTQGAPFNLPLLSSVIEERMELVREAPGVAVREPWLNQLGAELSRVQFEEQVDVERIRSLASDLASTEVRSTPALETIPYIGGVPAGTSRRADVVWVDRVLYVEQRPRPKLARLVPDRLGRVFGRPEITAAMHYCFGRSPFEVTEYMEANFKLAPSSTHQDESIGTPLPESGGISTPTARPNDVGATPEEAAEVANGEVMVVSVAPNEVLPSINDGNGSREEEGAAPEMPVKERRAPKVPGPSILERFARREGFQRESESRFYHADGSWIAKTSDEVFPWERRSSRGEVVRYYFPKDHCLERESLPLNADIWSLIEKFPESYALILSDPQGDPIEMTGSRLRALKDEGSLRLYPAAYRLTMDRG